MAGPFALVGSGEFLPDTDDVDRALASFDDDPPPRVAILPTAAGREGAASVDRWLELGVSHYSRLGGVPVPVRAVDAASANDPDLADDVASADLIYFSGGDPVYVTETLRGSAVWAAVIEAWRRGAGLAGCSAGAMMMGSVVTSPRSGGIVDGLGVFHRLCVIPHFDRFDQFRPGMAASITAAVPPRTQVVGVDENTGLVFDGAAWTVMGNGRVWILDDDRVGFEPGETVSLDTTFRL